VEQRVYELVALRYLAQFLPAFEFHETKIEVDAEGERFAATGRQTVAEGWTLACKPIPAEQDASDPEESDHEDRQPLPIVREGEGLTIERIVIADRRTAPPRRFSDGSLIQAMTGIARFVQDPSIKKLLTETDGLGTPATQAQIIETLFERRFIERRGRQIVSTAVGRALIEALPDLATRPDMTALWEAAMRNIANGHARLPVFLGLVADQLRKLVTEARTQGRPLRVAAPTAPGPVGRSGRRRRAAPRVSAHRTGR
jgi:DNA topoisomerase-3